MPHAPRSLRLVLLLTLTAVAGCFSLGRDAPTQRHFVLGATGLIAPESQAEELAGIAIGLRQLQIADYLESPLIVVRRGPHQITFSEFNRWGEDLGGGINRAVAGYLARRAAFENIDIVPWPPRTEHDYLIQLHLLRFEGLAPESMIDSDGAAHLLVNWEIIAQMDGTVLARGRTDYQAVDWQVGDYESLVTMLDVGLRELSDDLIAGLQTVVSP